MHINELLICIVINSLLLFSTRRHMGTETFEDNIISFDYFLFRTVHAISKIKLSIVKRVTYSYHLAKLV